MRKVTVFKNRDLLVVECTGVFHQWGANYEEFETGPGNYTTAIIERTDGTVIVTLPECIRFKDVGNKK